jgi:hypothetical protein
MNKVQTGADAYLRKIQQIEKDLNSIIKANEDFNKDKRLYIVSRYEILKYLYEQEKLNDDGKQDLKISIEYTN